MQAGGKVLSKDLAEGQEGTTEIQACAKVDHKWLPYD